MLKQKLTNRIIVRKYLGGAPHTAVLNFASMENIILSVITVSITGHMTENKVDVVLRSHLVAVFNPTPGQTFFSRKDLNVLSPKWGQIIGYDFIVTSIMLESHD